LSASSDPSGDLASGRFEPLADAELRRLGLRRREESFGRRAERGGEA
jgi:hypothetical protein